jgi:glycine cleavage system H protein
VEQGVKMKFTPSHEWINASDDVGIVGITSSAQEELGEVVYIELPKVGAKVQQGEEVVVIESTKAAADIYAPVSGEIIAVNTTLLESLTSLNESPEKEGWLFTMKIEDKEQLDHLLNYEEYLDLVASD